MDRPFTWFAGRVASLVGQPAALAAAFALVIAWAATGPAFGFSDTRQLAGNTGTTIATFLIVFLIQNSLNRDAAGLLAKLDELPRAVQEARPGFIGVEHLTDGQIDDLRAALEREAGKDPGKAGTAGESVERLLKRY